MRRSSCRIERRRKAATASSRRGVPGSLRSAAAATGLAPPREPAPPGGGVLVAGSPEPSVGLLLALAPSAAPVAPRPVVAGPCPVPSVGLGPGSVVAGAAGVASGRSGAGGCGGRSCSPRARTWSSEAAVAAVAARVPGVSTGVNQVLSTWALKKSSASLMRVSFSGVPVMSATSILIAPLRTSRSKPVSMPARTKPRWPSAEVLKWVNTWLKSAVILTLKAGRRPVYFRS
ncbi:hypothetical protein [Hydrogenophaga taeniospiralis]|uniref:hypothetical protein n=1 Tax=Hydrogenophaga taeniospiralis TaxID=65656 RepID=UPI0024351EE5|nr:hypothetical protein [Hydrogenophaga taeniospiralis]